MCTYQPSHAVVCGQAEVAGVLRQVCAEMQACTRYFFFAPAVGRPQSHDCVIIARQYTDRVLSVNMCLGFTVSRHVAVPVQVVLRQIKNTGGGGFKVVYAVELKTRQLQHPDLRQIVQALRQSVEQSRTDIACDGHFHAGTLKQQTGESCHRGFAVGAGDGQHFGLVRRFAVFQMFKCVGKQCQLGSAPQSLGLRRLPDACDFNG